MTNPHPDPVDVHVGNRVRQRRKDYAISTASLAKKLGITYQQIQKYETGKNRLPVEKLYALKHFYDVPFEVFFESEAPPKTRYESDFIIDRIYTRLKEMKNSAKRQHLCHIIDLLLREKETTS